MEKRKIHPEGPEFSRLITGVWRWDQITDQQTEELIGLSLDLGISSFDHADIYGDHTVEEKFGRILQRQPGLRNRMELISKCGIKFPSAHRPQNKSHIYDTTYKHIVWSAENSLKQLHTDHLDLLLIHRPDPLSNPQEIAEAFQNLRQQGKVLYFGVSNYSGPQFRLLQKHCPMPLVTNQVELSLTAFDPIFNGDIDVLMEHKASPMAWSPLAGGKLLEYQTKFHGLANLKNQSVPQLALSWLLLHPSNVFPILGTTQPNRLKELARVMEMPSMDKDTWFAVLQASRGYDIP